MDNPYTPVNEDLTMTENGAKDNGDNGDEVQIDNTTPKAKIMRPNENVRVQEESEIQQGFEEDGN